MWSDVLGAKDAPDLALAERAATVLDQRLPESAIGPDVMERIPLGAIARELDEVASIFKRHHGRATRTGSIGERLHPRIFAEALAPLAGGLFRAAQAPPDGCVVEAALGQKHDAGTLDVALWRQSTTSNTLQITRRCPRNRQRQC